jgi:transcription initiation factor TFIIH subunit 4
MSRANPAKSSSSAALSGNKSSAGGSDATAAAAAAAGASSAKKPKTSKPPRMTVGVLDYIQTSLPRAALLDLYTDEERGRYVCRATLQRLPDTLQQIVVRLSCCGGSFPQKSVQIWTKQTSAARHARNMQELYQWAIIKDKPTSTSSTTPSATTADITLTEEFHKGLKDSLHSLDASPWTALSRTDIETLERDAKAAGTFKHAFSFMSSDDLERYTQTQWDAVLHYLVGTPNLQIQPNPAVTHFLLETGLMQLDPEYRGLDPDDAPLVITQKGYDFMLQDNAQQMWHFVVQYLHSIERQKKAKALQREALLLLICLSFARFGECYSAASLVKDGRTMMKDLALFGLLYVKKIGKTSVFYPTRVAMQLVGDTRLASSGGGGSEGGTGGGMWSLSSKALESALSHPRPRDSSHLAIIVQTNFQLCAYTTSELHVSMLGLFCDVQTIRRLPNVVFMSITRDSVKGAFALGIQAKQILRFLEKHAHPKLRTSEFTTGNPIPANVVDQVYLWDRERHRVQWNEVYIHQCMLQGEFQAVHRFTTEMGCHAWSSEGRNQLYISYPHAERVQTFVRSWRAKAAGA